LATDKQRKIVDIT